MPVLSHPKHEQFATITKGLSETKNMKILAANENQSKQVVVVNTIGNRTRGGAKSGWNKTTVEECLSMQIGSFLKHEISGGAICWRSRRSGEVMFSATYLADRVSRANDPYLLLQHADQYPLTRGQGLQYRIQLVATEYGPGGQSWFFLCPGSSPGNTCDRIVRKLYLPNLGTYFACRRCHNLCYRTRDARHRALSRSQAIRRRLGGSGSVYEPIPDKPGRMRWETYEGLRSEVIEAETKYFGFLASNSLVEEEVEEETVTEKPVTDDAMGRLANCRQEEFAQHLARGLNGSKAYVAAGYPGKGAKQSASRLRKHPVVAARVRELQCARSAAVMADAVARKTATSNPGYLQAWQTEYDRLRDTLSNTLEVRGAALANEAAGGGTGFIKKRALRRIS